MVYLILDTNIWIYLANGLDIATGKHSDQHFELLSSLQAFREKGEAIVLVNDVILAEWERNRRHTETQIEKLTKKLESSNDTFKDIKRYCGGADIDTVQRSYEDGLKAEIQKNVDHIKNVERFLTKGCVHIPIREEEKLKATNLSLEKKAPFHNNRNNTADAVILLSSAHYIDSLEPYGDGEEISAFFISNNIEDFANQKKTDFHPDIKNCIGNSVVKYERYLGKAISLSKSIIAEMNAYNEHQRWLVSIYFSCKGAFCAGNDDFTPWGYLDNEVAAKYKSAELFDDSQMTLFPELPIVPKADKMINYGECVICSTPHYECPECEELIANDHHETIVTCPNCSIKLDLSMEKGYVIIDDTNEDEMDE